MAFDFNQVKYTSVRIKEKALRLPHPLLIHPTIQEMTILSEKSFLTTKVSPDCKRSVKKIASLDC